MCFSQAQRIHWIQRQVVGSICGTDRIYARRVAAFLHDQMIQSRYEVGRRRGQQDRGSVSPPSSENRRKPCGVFFRLFTGTSQTSAGLSEMA